MNMYEVSISNGYDAPNPSNAAKQFLDNLRMDTDWYIEVRDIKTGEVFTVDSADWESWEENKDG